MRIQSRPRRLAAGAVVAGLAAALVTTVLVTRRGHELPPTPAPAGGALALTPTSSTAPPAPSTFTVAVDATVTPARATIPGLRDDDATRPIGRLETDDGAATDVVRDEVIVATTSADELAGFLARWRGTVLDTWPGQAGEPTEHLVRVDPSTAPVAQRDVAADLLALEPHAGAMRVGDDATLRLLSIAAAEAASHGTEVSLNWLEQGEAVADGMLHEAPDRKNPFDWSIVDSARTQQIGLDVAWQLLDAHGRLDDRSVRLMVSDGGFSYNADFPPVESVTLRHAEWGDSNRMDCGKDSDCPYHGTDVVLTLMGQHDNGYGTAGPAGPVAELVAVAVHPERWTRLRKLEDMVDEYRPDVVNMSYTSTITAFRAASQAAADRRYGHMVADGALLVAAAGNQARDVDTETCFAGVCSESRLIIPCESKYVLCVGGLAHDANQLQPPNDKGKGSNYGQHDSSTSVEIYAPWMTVSIADHDNAYGTLATRDVGGTSFASPFVAGVAALVKAADPSLGPTGIRQILLDTAHLGVAGTWITGSQRRVNAAGAVARALGVEITDPVVTIESPTHGESHLQTSWLQLRGTATDFRGAELPISWSSSIDGELSDGPELGPVSLGELSLGLHSIKARAVDVRGIEAVAEIRIEVVEQAPEMKILTPVDGAVLNEGSPITLLGTSRDPDDFWQSLDDGEVWWEVRRPGDDTVIASRKGHDGSFPGTALGAGDYELTFRSDDGGTVAQDTVSIEVRALPAHDDPPVPEIIEPEPGVVLSGAADVAIAIDLEGQATDPEDGVVDGTHFQWVAREGDDEVIVCTGAAFPAAAFPTAERQDDDVDDCTTARAELEPHLHPWTIELRVVDSAGPSRSPARR